jgi:hypothetical protein
VRRVAPVAAALAASLLLASCGGGGGSLKPPQGPPSARHPSSDIAAELAAEEMRVHLLVAARLYNNGRFSFATQHMATAKAEYGAITAAVRRRDSALDREFHAAFGVIAGQIDQREPALAVTTRMGLVQGQLLDAAISDSVSGPARNDPGVTAQVMSRLAAQGAQDYALAVAQGGFTDRGRRAYQDAFGLITRASSLSHQISNFLGPQRGAVINGLNDAHNKGFPTGVLVPRHLDPAGVAGGVGRAQAAVSKRFGFPA